jgi:D-alanine--poly(phosphoribitol) ligase subunit 1
MGDYVYNLGQKFDEIVARHANRTAIRYPDGKEYTFNQLSKLADNFADYLLRKGVVIDDVIAIFNDKSIECFALMLACNKAGITYTNLDINSPEERLVKIIERCNPRLVFVDPVLGASFTLAATVQKEALIYLSEIRFEVDVTPAIPYDVTGATPVYIMFTSGSTGFPKGAVMSHANVLNLINWGKQTFGITDQDIATNVNPIYFDNSVFDFYSAVYNGAALVPFNGAQTRNPHALVQEVQNTKCTVWFSVPSMLVYLLTTKAIEAHSLPALRTIIFGGEGFPKPKLKKLYELFGDRIQLVNVYGPTECTCICSSYNITETDFDNIVDFAPLGKLAPNFSYEIIPQETGNKMVGELCLKGPNVGLGYYRDKERTEKSFVQNPFNINYHEIVYKTGDLVRLDEGGEFHFLGRTDNQVKHMGYRIEMEEIEAGLNSIHGVKESAVVYKKLGDGLGNIIGFVAVQEDVSTEKIMTEIKKKVPEYMVPKKIYAMDALPKNSNGKIDRVELKNGL